MSILARSASRARAHVSLSHPHPIPPSPSSLSSHSSQSSPSSPSATSDSSSDESSESTPDPSPSPDPSQSHNRNQSIKAGLGEEVEVEDPALLNADLSETTLFDDLRKIHSPSSPNSTVEVDSDSDPTQGYKLTSTGHLLPPPSKPIPPLLKRIRWFNLGVVTITPALALYGVWSTEVKMETMVFAFVCYVVNMLGITAGYHRLWSHRSYTASLPLQYALAIMGAGSVQGSIRWWARGHRSHHRYTDTPLDPYSAKKGFIYSHIGWMLVHPLVPPGRTDVSDLTKNKIVMWQRKWYFWLAFIWGVVVPLGICGLGWGDWWGGLYFGVFGRIVFVHHSTFSVNSVAHYLGSSTYDDRHTPRDHLITALLTLGEGYHNFHHQFPTDYRNAILYTQFDPTKWFIWCCERVGLARGLQRFGMNEIRKGRLMMEMRRLWKVQGELVWGKKRKELPVWSWEEYKESSKTSPLVLIAGFIHDVSPILDNHPGGRTLLNASIGKDATAPFFGGVYEHSNAARNLLSTMRIAALEGGMETIPEHAIVPGSRLYIAEARWDD